MKHSSKILDNGVDQKADKVITWIDVRKEDDHDKQKLGGSCKETARFPINTLEKARQQDI